MIEAPRSGSSLALAASAACAAVFALAWAAYWPAIDFGYVEVDDPWYFVPGEFVSRGVSKQGLTWAFLTNAVANWHPLTWISLMIDVEVFGDNPRGHHLVNIALHASNAALLLLVMLRMTGRLWPSALVAAGLAVHPIHVESVAWLSERKDVLCAFFWLLTMHAYVGYVRRPGRGRYALVALWLACALLSKPMAVTLPFALLLLDVWPLKRAPVDAGVRALLSRLAKLTLEKAPLIALAAGAAAMTVYVQRVASHMAEGEIAALPQRLENVAVSYVRYLVHMFWPADLVVLYPNPAQIGRPMWLDWQWMAAAAALAAIIVATLLALRRKPWLAVGWLWFLGTMTPVIGFIQVGRQAMADRYAYLPFIGLYAIVAWALAEMAGGKRRRWAGAVLGVAGIAVVVALALAARAQVWTWRDNDTLFARAIALTDDNWFARAKMADGLLKDGRTDEARKHIEAALAINPRASWLRINYGATLARLDRWYEAQEQFELVIAADPQSAAGQMNLGMALLRRNQPERGLACLEQAATLAPEAPVVHEALLQSLATEGRWSEALEALTRAEQQCPRFAPTWKTSRQMLQQRMVPPITSSAMNALVR